MALPLLQLDKNERVVDQGANVDIRSTTAQASLLQADRASEQEARGRAGNEHQAPDQDLAVAEIRQKQAVVCDRAKERQDRRCVKSPF
jgi:hypothetical protein